MSYDQKVQAARELLGKHNNGISEESAKIDIEGFINCLKQSGGTTSEALSACTWEDIEDCKVPRILARQIAKIFRSELSGEAKEYVKPSKAKAMSPRELLERFDPAEPESVIGKELDERSKGQAFLIIKEGKVLVDASHDLLSELKLGHSAREFFNHEGVPYRVFKVGDRPDQLADVNPLFHGESLRPNGDCTQINKSWKGIDLNVRQLVYLGVKNGEISISTKKDAVDYYNISKGADAFETLTSYAPEAFVQFGELEERGELPSLKRKLSSTASKSNPFYGSDRAHVKF